MLFENHSLVYLLLPVIGCLVIVSLLLRSRIKARESEPFQCAVKLVRMNSLVCGIMFIVLWLTLPMTASLSTFGLPKTLEDVQSARTLLGILQTYNRAIVRTTDVLFWFLFTFVWWFLLSYYDFVKAIGSAHRLTPQDPDPRS